MEGLSQKIRQQRINEMKSFSVVDNSMESLLTQMETFAASIRYYGSNEKEEEFFDQFVSQVRKIHRQINENACDQNAEPAQSLIYVFLKHLHDLTSGFNARWSQYAYWYFNDVLKIAPPPSLIDTAWVVLSKSITDEVVIPQGTGFTYDAAEAESRICYRTMKDIKISDIKLRKIACVRFEKDTSIWPASLCNQVTSLTVREQFADSDGKLQNTERPKASSPLGLQISSPSLLLREGKRYVCMTFKSEQATVGIAAMILELAGKIHQEKKEQTDIRSFEDIRKEVYTKIFRTVFFLEISTDTGWTKITNLSVSLSEDTQCLTLKFELPESFPQTTACQAVIHKKQSRYPVLRILLNNDSWLYPYSWLSKFIIEKIHIVTHVEGVGNLLLYNDLGMIDNSVPFTPFGSNTERGAWFVVGNYEMAVKNVQTASLSLLWQQIPQDNAGLVSYYEAYNNGIDNRSFQLRAKFLSDYRWKNTKNTAPLYLFSTKQKCKDGTPESHSALSEESTVPAILLDEMRPVSLPESEYTYSIHSKNGFINLVLENPLIGFGEKRYRQLFTEQITLKALRKKTGKILNPPIMPLIERMTLSYSSEDEIDLTRWADNDAAEVAHLYPLGEQLIYPNKDNQPKPFLYSMDTDFSFLFALDNVRGDEMLDLYLDFKTQPSEVSLTELAQLVWYWGNGYHWEKLPDGSICKNTTMGFLTSGYLSIYIPEIPLGLKDSEGLLWLRAGIVQNERNVSELRNIYVNAIRVGCDKKDQDIARPIDFVLNCTDIPVPGISEIKQISSFSRKRSKEEPEDKLMRISEFITHRDKAVTVRDYERMTLQAFPEVSKVKCLPNTDTKATDRSGVVTLVVIPEGKGQYKYFSTPELLIRIEQYFRRRTSAYVRFLDAINPEYEELLVRCRVEYRRNNYTQSFADIRAILRRIIDNVIAPWYQEGEAPCFATNIRMSDLYAKIKESGLVDKVDYISVVQLSGKGEDTYLIREYNDENDVIKASHPYTVLIPSENHVISSDVNELFGVGEMGVNKDFVIWQDETEIH